MTTYFCRECGYETTKWSGRCPVCSAWDSFKESESLVGKMKGKNKKLLTNEKNGSDPIKDITIGKEERLLTGIAEFDGVLGGGIISGMVCLIGGEPGIGKSTLMLQIAQMVADKGKNVLYVSGEESREQIKYRAVRLGVFSEHLRLYCSNAVEQIMDIIRKESPEMVVIDSIQSIGSLEQSGIPGSLSQVREVSMLLTHYAKQKGITIFLIGHITKEGIVAGPKLIEHLVDTVLYFEGDSSDQLKILKATKNRYGSTNEIGVFEMQEAGLTEISNPSRIFVQDEILSAGSAVGCVIEGTRSFLIEVQALVTPAIYGNAQRIALGIDHRKLSLLLAVIEKKLALKIREKDIFVKLSGGLKLNEPALDLPFIAAILSSFEDRELPAKMVLIGELGLNGEIRSVTHLEKRITEALKLGYDKIVIPRKSNYRKGNKNITNIDRLEEVYPIIFSR